MTYLFESSSQLGLEKDDEGEYSDIECPFENEGECLQLARKGGDIGKGKEKYALSKTLGTGIAEKLDELVYDEGKHCDVDDVGDGWGEYGLQCALYLKKNIHVHVLSR